MLTPTTYILLFIIAFITIFIVILYVFKIHSNYTQEAQANNLNKERFADDSNTVGAPVLIENDFKRNDVECKFIDDIYTIDKFNMRNCEVYFTSNVDECDNAKLQDPNSTCKYKFEGWSEFESAIRNGESMPTSNYAYKIYNQNYVIPVLNQQLISKCYKSLKDDTTSLKYEYKMNDFVMKDCEGGKRTEINMFNNNNYASMKFVHNPAINSQQHYNGILNTICSIKYAKNISALKKNIYKLVLNTNNDIITLQKGRFDDEQRNFITDNNFNPSEFIAKGAFNIAYNAHTSKFKIFSNVQNNLNKNVQIFKMKYNYLCGDSKDSSSQVLELKSTDAILMLEQLYVIQLSVSKDYIVGNHADLEGMSREWYINNNLTYNENTREDKKLMIQQKLQQEELNRITALTNEYNNHSDLQNANTIILNTSNMIQTKYTRWAIYKSTLSFSIMNTYNNITSGKYLLYFAEPALQAGQNIFNKILYSLNLNNNANVATTTDVFNTDLNNLDAIQNRFNMSSINCTSTAGFYHKSSQDVITIRPNKFYVYKFISSIFLQKGYYKFRSYLYHDTGNAGALVNSSILYIQTDTGKYVSSCCFFSKVKSYTIDTSMHLRYNMWTTKDYIYYSKSGFYNICFTAYGYNANNMAVNPSMRFSYEYFIKLPSAYTYVQKISDIDVSSRSKSNTVLTKYNNDSNYTIQNLKNNIIEVGVPIPFVTSFTGTYTTGPSGGKTYYEWISGCSGANLSRNDVSTFNNIGSYGVNREGVINNMNLILQARPGNIIRIIIQVKGDSGQQTRRLYVNFGSGYINVSTISLGGGNSSIHDYTIPNDISAGNYGICCTNDYEGSTGYTSVNYYSLHIF